MKKRILILGVITLLFFGCTKYPPFDFTYGGNDEDGASSIIETSDGNLAIAGSTKSKGAGDSDFWLLKIDKNKGNIVWEQTYGGTKEDGARSIIETSDGNLAVASYTKSKGAGDADFWVLKIDKNNGNIVWEKTYGGSDGDYPTSIIETSDGNLAVAGWTKSKGAGGWDFWLLKINQNNGNIVWEKTYGGNLYDGAYSIIETSDGHLAVAGYTWSKGAGDADFWLLKINKNDGNILWEKTYGASDYDGANAIIETSDGNLAVAGFTNSKGAGSADFWVLKIDKNNGNKIWEKTYGGSDYDGANAIIETSDGNLAVAGYTESKGAGNKDFWILKINKNNGKLLWEKTYGGSNYDEARFIIETSKGNLAVAGYTWSKGAGEKDSWILRLYGSDGAIVGSK